MHGSLFFFLFVPRSVAVALRLFVRWEKVSLPFWLISKKNCHRRANTFLASFYVSDNHTRTRSWSRVERFKPLIAISWLAIAESDSLRITINYTQYEYCSHIWTHCVHWMRNENCAAPPKFTHSIECMHGITNAVAVYIF